MNDRCFYCDRAEYYLEVCCDRHPDDLVCTDRDGCRDFILAALNVATLGLECPACGDTYHDLPRHLELNYKGCALRQ